MKNFVTIEGRALAAAMKLANAIVERRNTIPILSHVKITHDKDGIAITGTDLDIYITQRLDVIDGAGDWSVCVRADLLYSIARAAGVANVRIEPATIEIEMRQARKNPATMDVAKITIGDNDAFYELQTLPETDFPEDGGGKRTIVIDTFTNGMLAAQLSKVAYCISTEETRYYLNGIFWDLSHGQRSFVATDGHRLACCRYSKEEAPSPAVSRIIPRKTCNFIMRHLTGKDVTVFSVEKENYIEIVAPGIVIRSKLIDGTYPDYRHVIPENRNLEYSFEFKRQELLTAISQVGVLATERGRAIRFFRRDARVALESKNPDFGSATVATQAVWPDEAAPSFSININYTRDVISTCLEDITLHMVDAGSPFFIKDADEDMTRVLMPMRV